MRISALVNVLSSVSAIRISRSLRAGVISTAARRSASVCAVTSNWIVLDVLLLDGRAAAGVEVAGEVAGQAGQRALPVHAVVLGEPLVLDRHDRQLHRVGDLIGGHLEPALGIQPRDRVPGGVDHRRDLRDVTLEKLRGAVGDDVGGAVGQQPNTAREREHQCRRQHPGQQTAPRQLRDGSQGRLALRHAHRLVKRLARGRTLPHSYLPVS